MPKMKSHSGTKKRFSRTGSGKLRRRQSWDTHLKVHKPTKRSRRLKGYTGLAPGDAKVVDRLLPRR